MQNEKELSSAQRELETALGALKPSGVAFDRDQMLFRAGQISARRRSRIWQGTTLLLAIFAGLLLLRQPEPQVIEQPNYMEVDQPKSEESAFAHATLEYRVNDRWYVVKVD